MKILSDSGKEKLRRLQTALVEIKEKSSAQGSAPAVVDKDKSASVRGGGVDVKEKKVAVAKGKSQTYTAHESSEYSHQMVEGALTLVAKALEVNDGMTPKVLQSLVEEYTSTTRHIDGGTDTGVPRIFNRESLELAKAWHKFLKGLTPADIGGSLSAFAAGAKILGIADASQLIQQTAKNVEAQILFYETIAKTAEFQQGGEFRALQQEIGELPDKLLKKLKDDEIKPAEFQAHYQAEVDKLLAKARPYPYLAIGNAFAAAENTPVVNLQEPQNYKMEEWAITGARGLLYCTLVDNERYINGLLAKLHKTTPPLNYAMNLLQQGDYKQHQSQFVGEVKAVAAQLQQDIKYYVPTFKSLSLKKNWKIEFIERVQAELITQLAHQAKDQTASWGTFAFNMYKFCYVISVAHEAKIQENNTTEGAKKVSPGRTAGILLEAMTQFMKLTARLGSNLDPYLQSSLEGASRDYAQAHAAWKTANPDLASQAEATAAKEAAEKEAKAKSSRPVLDGDAVLSSSKGVGASQQLPGSAAKPGVFGHSGAVLTAGQSSSSTPTTLPPSQQVVVEVVTDPPARNMSGLGNSGNSGDL